MAAFAVLFNLDYLIVESKIYTENLFVRTPPFPYLALSYLLAVLPALWMPLGADKPSDVTYWLLYLVVIIPSMFVPYHVLPTMPPDQVVVLPAVLVGLFGVLGLSRGGNRLPLPRLHVNPALFRVWLPLGIGVMFAVLAATHGFDFGVSLADPYGRRLEARETLVGGTVLAYVAAIFQRVLVPTALAYGIGRRIPALIVLGLVATVPSFVLAGEKTVLAVPIFMLLIALFLRRYRRDFGLAVVSAAFAVLALATFVYTSTGSSVVSDYGSRRLFAAPAQLSAYHWDYYSSHPKAQFSSGVFGTLGGKPGGLTPSQTIGREYLGSANHNANANIWASAYAELGYLGMFLVTLAVGVSMKFIDGAVRSSSFVVVALLAGFIGVAWAESAFQTSLLSAGVLPLLIVIYLLPKHSVSRQGSGSNLERPMNPVARPRPI